MVGAQAVFQGGGEGVFRREAIIQGQGATRGGPAEVGDHPAMDIGPSQGPCATMQVEDHGSRSRLGRDQPFGRYVTGHDGLDVDISWRFEEPSSPLHHGAVSFERSVPIEEGPPHVEEEPKAPASETGHQDVLGRSSPEADVARGCRRVALAPDNDRSTDRPVKGSTAAYPRFFPRVVAVEAT